MKKARKGLLQFEFPRKHSVRWRIVCRQFISEHSWIYSYRRKERKHWAEGEAELQCRHPRINQSLNVGCPRKECDLGQNASLKLRKFPTTSQQLGKVSWEVLKDRSGQCGIISTTETISKN